MNFLQQHECATDPKLSTKYRYNSDYLFNDLFYGFRLTLFFGILQRALYKELIATFLAVFVVLVFITFGTEVSRLLANAVKGEIPAGVVFELLFLKIPRTFDVVLPLVALIAVMLTFGRMHQDHEIVVMQSCGVAQGFFQKSLSVFLLPLSLFMLWVLLVVNPWSYQQERLLIDEAKTQAIFAGLTSGKFNELPAGQGVLYAQKIEQQGEMKNIWLQYRAGEDDLILTAKRGQLIRTSENAVLRLEDGWRYQNLHQRSSSELKAAIEVQRFGVFEGLIPELAIKKRHPRIAEKGFFELLEAEQGKEVALLHWRLVVPWGILVMGLVGLKLSKSGPRQGRFAKLFLALLLFIVYNQLLLAAKEMIEEGQSPWLMWVIPAVFLLWALSGHLKPEKRTGGKNTIDKKMHEQDEH